MERMGEVTAVQGDWLEVTFCRLDECEGCHACEGQPKKMKVKLKGEAKVGDAALVELDSGTVIKASAAAYLIPLAGLLIGMFAGLRLFPAQGDAAGAIGAFAGIGLGVAAIAITEKRRKDNAAWTPVVKRIVPARQEIK